MPPKLLIKYYNTINYKGDFPTTLVISEANFTATFSKLIYPRIKIMLDSAKVDYSCVTIFQASDLKEILEGLYIKTYRVTIASLYAFNMYHSIKLATIRKAETLLSRGFITATKNTINLCLELILFWGSSPLISFYVCYY